MAVESTNAVRYWKAVLPYYLKVSFWQSVAGWAAPLAIVVLWSIWTGLTEHRFLVNRVGLAMAAIFGGGLFVLALVTAVIDDLHRNWGRQQRTVAWNPALMWKVFIYLGGGFFLVAAFLAYHQGVWLTVFFVAMSVGCVLTAWKCL